ncbi:MAG: PilZ domain-containing protein [Phycisphaerae bacterium]
MYLTTELLARIVTDLRSDSPGRSRKRDQPRVGLRCKATVVSCDATRFRPQAVWIRDVSASGIGFRFTVALKKGQQFVLFVRRPRGGNVRVLCRVQHVDPCPGDNGFLVGAKLIAVLPAEVGQRARRFRGESLESEVFARAEPKPLRLLNAPSDFYKPRQTGAA